MDQKRKVPVIFRQRTSFLRILNGDKALLLEVTPDEVTQRHRHPFCDTCADHRPLMLPNAAHIHEEIVQTTIRLFVSGMILSAAISAWGDNRSFESGLGRTHLIELFTSEGCSSCPPAEAWLSKLKSEPGLWKAFVPLAFHVDYWDRLGWRDPFASKEWTARQYRYSANWRRSESVYTPGFVLDGRELLDRSMPPASNEKPGALKLWIANEKITAEFKPTNGETKDLDLHVAALGFDLNTKIGAGENSGRNLKQDFVVLSLAKQK